MHVAVEVPVALRSCCDGASRLSVSAETVREVLEQIEQRYPPLYRSVCDDSGAVRRHVNVFVNSSLLRQAAELDRSLDPGDIINIFQAVSGG